MDAINRLRNKLDSTDFKGERVCTIKSLVIKGNAVMDYAFFPGGNGLYRGIRAAKFPIGGTLILGSNFGSKEGFVDDFGNLLIMDERCGSTWVGMLERLRRSGIEPDECFFTNAWPFLHIASADKSPISKESPQPNKKSSNLDAPIKTWLADTVLMPKCEEFFKDTFREIRPRLIVALGLGPAAFLARIWQPELGPWGGFSWKDIDSLESGMAWVETETHKSVCVAVTHPSMANSKHRYAPYNTCGGEIDLMTSAAKEAGILSKQAGESDCNP